MKIRQALILALITLCLAALNSPAHAGDSTQSLSEEQSLEILYYEPLPPMALESRDPDSSDRKRSTPSWNWSLEAFGKTFNFVLESNHRLIASLPRSQREKIAAAYSLYRGTIDGVQGSWIRLTHVRDQWSGMIWDGEELYIIDPMKVMASALLTVPPSDISTHGIYRLSDTRELGVTTCGLGSPGVPAEPITDYKALLQELRSSVPAPAAGAGFNLDMAVVADVQFVDTQENNFGTPADAAVITRLNVVDGIFSEQVNVQINLVQIQELTQNGSLTSTNASTLLSQFGNFTNGSTFNHPGVAHLFTGRNLNGSTIGIAYLSSLCNARFGVGVDEIRGGGTAGAIVVAHELGHNFGAPHDNQGGSACANVPGEFIMNPSIITDADQFSQCSLDEMQPVVNGASCITVINFSPPVVSITSPVNGAFVSGAAPISFVGNAVDAEDGNLTANLVWTSDQDGQIGTGGSISAPLSIGTHRITAAVTDSDGNTATQFIIITVTEGNAGPVLFESHFDGGPDGFGYVDDAFRNTNQPGFASGTHEPAEGFTGGGLRVLLGGINDTSVLNMSGGWRRSFTLAADSEVTLSFRYNLTQAPDYESDEISEALLSVDNTLIGLGGGNDFLARIVGDGNGGNSETSGWVPAAISAGSLPAGTHTVTIGGFNNKKTFNNETTEVLIDDVIVRGTTNVPPSGLVSNITAASGKPYVAVDSGLQAGATVYIDRGYPFVTVPPAVQGATYIQTANDDKTSTDAAFLTFTLTEAATIYVGHDSRASSQPGWLASFANTGLQLSYIDTSVTFQLYAQSFGPGVVTLGGNELGSNFSMYTVAVVKGSLPPSSLVTNITVASGAPYVAADNGLQTGATVYLDRAYPFVTVPPALQGATYIRTANNDKTSTGAAFLTFTLTQAATVYIGYDSRASTQPGWLAPFTNTGLQLSYIDTSVTFQLYAQSFGPGVVTLGGNELSSNFSMYTVAVVPN